MPSGLDLMAALGNDEAAGLLRGDLERFTYAANLQAGRDFAAALGEEFREGSIPDIDLNTLRRLELPEAASLRSRSRRAFLGVSPRCSGLYFTPSCSAWPTSAAAASRSFSSIAWRARRSKSSHCRRASSGLRDVSELPGEPSLLDVQGAAYVRAAEQTRAPAIRPRRILAVVFNTLLLSNSHD